MSHLAKAYYQLGRPDFSEDDDESEDESDQNNSDSDDFEKTYNNAEKFFSDEISDSLNKILALEDRAEFYFYHNKPEKAEVDYRKALVLKELEFQEQTFQGNNKQVFGVYNRLVKGLSKTIDFDFESEKVEELYNHVVEFKENYAGEDSLEYYRDLNRLAKFYKKSREVEKATSNYEKALEVVEIGVDNGNSQFVEMDLANSLNILANIYFNQKVFDKAELLYKRILGLTTIYSGSANFKLGKIYNERQNFAKAEEFYIKARDFYKNNPKSNQENLIVSSDNLAAFYLNQNKFQQFKSVYDDLINYNNPATKRIKYLSVPSVLIESANEYGKNGNYGEAERYYKLAQELSIKYYGESNYAIFAGLGKIYQLQDKLSEAETQYKLVLEIFKFYENSSFLRVIPIDYFIESLNGLAQIYSGDKKFAEAEDLYKRSLLTIEKARGNPANEILKIETLESYAALLQELNRKQEADDMLARAKKEREKLPK